MQTTVFIIDSRIDEDLEFSHDFPELPQVGDTIEISGGEDKQPQCLTDLLNCGASETFTVARRGWRIDEQKTARPFVVIRKI